MCLHIAELTNKNTGSNSSSVRLLPTPTLGGLSLYLKGEPNQKTTKTTSIEARAVEIEKYPRTRYFRCWPFCIMYICTSDEPAHVHLSSSSSFP